MKQWMLMIVLITSYLTMCVCPLAADEKGKLERFESELEQPEGTRDRHHRHDDHHDHHDRYDRHDYDAGDIAAQGLIELLYTFFLAGMMTSGSQSGGELYRELKEEGSPALPTIRFEPSYQYVINDIHGVSGKLEAGYLLFGVDGEYLRYFEKGAGQDLTLAQGHVLLRTLFARVVGVNLALGVKSLIGEQTHTGFDFGIPFSIYFTKHLIMDIQPLWAVMRGKDLYDIGGGFSYKYGLFGVRAGYRMIALGGETLHGPNVGIFLQW